MSELKPVTYHSECDCGAVAEGIGLYCEEDGTLYGNECTKCGEEFTVLGWFERCYWCDFYHVFFTSENEKCEAVS